jgi:bile acid:Na+ symporter, BASS family
MYESLAALDDVKLSFSTANSQIINIALMFIMFGVALDIKWDNFKELIQHPRLLLAGFLSQTVVLPAATFAFVSILGGNITIGVALGTILVAACPGGNISNFITSFAKGNVALAVSLTALSTLLAVVTTPLNFNFWGNLYTQNHAMLRPITLNWREMVTSVITILGIPMLLGMACAFWLPQLAHKLIKPFQRVSLVFFVGLIIIAFAKNYDVFLAHIGFVFVVVLLHNAIALGTGYSMGKIFRLTTKNCRTLTIETGIHNSGLGLALLFNPTIFPPDLPLGGMTIIAAWWGIWHIVTGMFLAFIWRKSHANT